MFKTKKLKGEKKSNTNYRQ